VGQAVDAERRRDGGIEDQLDPVAAAERRKPATSGISMSGLVGTSAMTPAIVSPRLERQALEHREVQHVGTWM
jgi:hypothetical protein